MVLLINISERKLLMILYDSHTHCNYSTDSNATPEAMLESAMRKGLTGYYYTDHNDFDIPPEQGKDIYKLDFPSYISHITRLKEQYDGIFPVFIGVEQGLSVEYADAINSYDSSNRLDFIIGSTHMIDGSDPYYPEFWINRSVSDVMAQYYNSIYESLKVCTNFDVYGHIDYVTRYIPYGNHGYSWMESYEIIRDILKTIIRMGKGIEINTSNLFKGLPSPNPEADIIKLYRKLGGEIITIGSDAHKPEAIAAGFNKATDILTAAGFRYIAHFEKRQPVFTRL